MSLEIKIKIYQQILDILHSLNIPFEEIEHPPVASCADSAKYRAKHGWSGIGSKNILFHAKGRFYLVVTTAAKEIKARKFKKEFGTKNIRFATTEEVVKVTGCEVGALPPFGFFNSELPIYVDDEIFNYDYFMFNPALHTKSIRIEAAALKKIYRRVEQPVKLFKEKEGKLEFILISGESG
jgi:Ala-tRNA(Pro) deacylase